MQVNTVSELLDRLPKEELEMVLFLRTYIVACIPNSKEQLAHHLPFYYGHSRICYLWPASVPGGGVEKGVAIGFCKSSSLADETFEATKDTSRLTFASMEDIDVALLKQQIDQAVTIDAQIAKAKRRKIQ